MNQSPASPAEDVEQERTKVEVDLFGPYFTTEHMSGIFSPEKTVAAWSKTEAALAFAQGSIGIIPSAAAMEICDVLKSWNPSIAVLHQGVADTWHPLIAFIREARTACGDVGEYIHWGATTQDIMDTGAAIQYKQGLCDIEGNLRRCIRASRELVMEHADTAMAGRTHGQHALPTTFGYKVASWAEELTRDLARLYESAPRVCVGNLSGATGTMAALYPHGPAVESSALARLGLGKPGSGYDSSRDRIAEIFNTLGLITATCGRIAGEIIQLQKTEIDEVAEPFEMGKIGSSTMPQKRNPMACEAIVACAIQVRGLAGVGLDVMRGEHERDMGTWAAEWRTLPEAFRLSAAAMQNLAWVLEGLVVNQERMLVNLNATRGLIVSEALMMQLAKSIGRQRAHDVVYELAMDAIDSGQSLEQALGGRSDLKAEIKGDPSVDSLNPLAYTGHAAELARAAANEIDEVLRQHARSLSSLLADLYGVGE